MYMVERMEKCMHTFEKDIRRANRSEVFMDMPAMAGAISGTRRQLAIAYVAKLMFISEETCVRCFRVWGACQSPNNQNVG